MEQNQGLQTPPPDAGALKSNGIALASMIVGIVSAIIGCFYIGVLIGPTAIVLGIIGLKRCKKDPTLPGKGMAIAGIICGIVGTLAGLGMIIFLIVSLLKFSRGMPVSPFGP
ncbi:MAG: DUF4190 domain-containing protein [Planctomycetota bacterium]